VQGLVVPVVADPDLGLDEHLSPVDTGLGDGLTDLTLIAVGRGGVDVPVPGRQGRLNGIAGLDRRGLEDTETDSGR
jgi:hypothetical protein